LSSGYLTVLSLLSLLRLLISSHAVAGAFCVTLQLMAEQCEEPGRHLADLQARGANITPLLKLLLPSLAAALPLHPQLQPLLSELLHKVTFDAADVQAAAVQLLQAGAADAADAAAAGKQQQQHLQQVLRVFDLRYPEQLDAAINAALQQAAAAAAGSSDADAAAAARAGKKAAKQKKSKQQNPTDANSLFDFVQQCFSGSRHEVVPGAQQQQQQQDAPGQQQQQQALTLSLAVSAPASEMRIMALQKLDAICAAGNAPESTQQLLHSSLVTCLRDDSLAVAGTAAAAAGLAGVPAELQLPALQYMLARAADALAAGSASKAADNTTTSSSSSATGGKAILKAAKAALAAVAAVGQRASAADDAASAADSSNAAVAGDVQQQAAALLLEYALADKRLKKLARAAVSECCSATWHPLLQALSAAPNVAAALAAGEPAEAAAAAPATSDSKRRKKAGSGDADAAPAAAAAEGKHAAAVVLNKAVVQALADAMCASGSSSTGTALLDAAAAVADLCGPRCRHLLLLAMLKAATAADGAAAAAAVEVPATPSRGRARSRHARHSSSQVAGDDSHSAAVSSARIAVALLHMLEQQLPSSSSSKRSTSSSSSLALPDDWATTAAEVLDADSLPNLGHLQQLHSQLPQLQAALLLSGLRSALQAAAVDSLTELLGQPVQLFTRLAAAAAAAGASGKGLQEHLQLLVQKSCAQPQQQLAFLSGVYGLPAGCCPEAAQIAALQLLHVQASEGAAWGVGSVDASSTSSSWLLSLLAAAGSSSKRVRRAAVDAIVALPDAVAAAASSWVLPGGFTAEHLSELVTALQQHEELLRNSSGSIVQLLCSAAAVGGASAMDVDGAAAGTSKGSRSRRGSRAGSTKAAAGGQTEDGAEMHLPAGCAAAFQQLLLQALPQLHAESDLLAAELAVAVLAAGSSSDAASSTAAAAAACELLQGLLLGLASNAQKVATQRASSKQQQPMWQQLADMLGSTDAVADASVQLQQLRSAAAVASLQLITSDSVAADSTKVGSSFTRLLQLPFVDAAAAGLDAAAAAAAASSKLSDAQLAAVAPARVTALQQFDAALFAALDQEQQQAAFTAALQTHASDGDASCRAAARAALERIPVTANMVLQLLQRVGSSGGVSKQQQSRAKRSKRSSSTAGSQSDAMDVDTLAAAAAVGPVLAADLDAAIAALELLQWKEEVADKQQLLLQPLQVLLQLLTPLMGSIAESYTEEDAATAVDETDDAAPADDGVAPAVASPSAAGYAAQLVLATLEQLAKEDNAAAAAVDPGLVLSCATAAPDGAVRNAALLLLAVLSQQSPEDVLGHVLQVCACLWFLFSWCIACGYFVVCCVQCLQC
jgi:hypothetical protein